MAFNKTVALAILLVISLVSADHVKGQKQVGGIEGQELVGDSSDGVHDGVTPKSDCIEKALYHGPCLGALCAAGCLLQLHHGGHCKGGLFGTCLCFVCS